MTEPHDLPPTQSDTQADEQSPSPQQAIFAMTSEAILAVGEDFIISQTNPAFTKVLGWTRNAALGQRCTTVLRCHDERKLPLCDTPRCPLVESLRAEASEKPAVVRDLLWQTRAGAFCEVSASFTAQRPLRSGAPRRAVIVGRDVTTLNVANRMRSNFISMVSHELRTPLHSINGFLEIVLDGQVGPLNERQYEFLNYARTSTQQLTTLVEDILFISKADSGQFTLRLGPVQVPTLVSQVFHVQESAAIKAQVTLVADLAPNLPVLEADALRLQQVLSNLVGNAIKFSLPQTSVSVRVAVEGANMRFEVSDQGRGIAPEEQERIFERFYQSESSAGARAGGYGLGLAIAQMIVEQHHGRIWVESTTGHGATFCFTLPLSAPQS